MGRVSVVGSAGSGKTTFGRALAAAMDVPFLELDSVFHLPGWQELPDDAFRARVAEFTEAAADGWVIDGNYTIVQRSEVWPRADTVIWLDLPRHRVMRQVIGRSVRRSVRREELWNGNRERLRNLVAWDPEKSIIRWAWTNYHRFEAKWADATTDPRWANLDFRRLRSRTEADRLIEELSR